MHSDRVSMHAIAHGVSIQYGPKVYVLVWHGSHSHAMASWSSSKLRIRSKAYVELTCPWPERADMGVPIAVCMAVMMGKLGPVPSDEQIALQSESLASPCQTTRVGVS